MTTIHIRKGTRITRDDRNVASYLTATNRDLVVQAELTVDYNTYTESYRFEAAFAHYLVSPANVEIVRY